MKALKKKKNGIMQADQSCLIKPTACIEKVNKVNDDVILTFSYIKLKLRDKTEQLPLRVPGETTFKRGSSPKK